MEGLRRLVPAMAALGHSVEVLSIDQPGDPWLEGFPGVVHPLGPRHFGDYRYAPQLVPWLRVHAADYDVIVVRGLWQYLGYATWKTLRNSSTPYAVFTHGMLDPWFRRQYPAKHVKKWLYWSAFEWRILRDAAAVLFTSEEERLLAHQSFRPFRCHEIVVNYGTSAPPDDPDAQRAAFFSKYPALRGKRLALFMSRLDRKKGCDLLLQAFARTCRELPDWHLVMAGPDKVGWQADLQRLAAELGITDRVTWTGMLRDELKWGAYRAAEFFVLPSHSENFGIVVAEALACGVPALISNKVNIWREIEADGAGLVAPDTEEGTERLFRDWLTMAPDARQKMRERTTNCFRNRFEVSRAAANLAEVFASLRAPSVRQLSHAIAH